MNIETQDEFWTPIRLRKKKNGKWTAKILDFSLAPEGETAGEALLNLQSSINYMILCYFKNLHEGKK